MAMMMSQRDVKLLSLLVFLLGAIGNTVANNLEAEEPINSRVPSSCSLVMAPSSIPNAGWGVFALKKIERGQEVIFGDVVIQVSDLNATYAAHAKRLSLAYGWDASETGGQYEGKSVMSMSPGVGMLANGSPRSFNVLPKLEPDVGEAEVVRHQSAGAGAFSHYHNFSFFATSEINPGDEVLCNYRPAWFQQRKHVIKDETEQKEQKLQRSSKELLEEGFCLDNIKPGQSTIPHAGRGAFATRSLSKGSIVAPVPILPITKREAMDTTRMRQVAPDKSVPSTTQQLLLNYCFGHPKSSILFFPYSPIVNLINHSNERVNVKLQWSSVNQQHEMLTLEHLENVNTDRESGAGSLLLELVATRDIAEGGELLLDYGESWQNAWDQHVEEWKPYERHYAPAYVMEEAAPLLATQEEQQTNQETYPPNLITSCFYQYMPSEAKPGRDITSVEWKPTRGIFELRNLRPCTVMQRFEVETQGDKEEEATAFYTVVIRNRYGLPPQERVPAGHMHVVTHVPRRAIRFTDKIYTTDQHLPDAFRKEIGFGDDVFPAQWMDLADSGKVERE